MSTKARTIFFFCGIGMAVSELAKQLCLTFYVHPGIYEWWYLPFQLCSIPMYLCLILGLSKSHRVQELCRAFIASFGLLGGLLSFCDTSGFHYPVVWLTVHSYLWHILLILLGIYAARQADRTRCSFRAPAILYLVLCCAAQLLDILIEDAGLGPINMFYISLRYPMMQIGFAQLVPILGNAAVLLLYILLTILGAGLLYALERP